MSFSFLRIKVKWVGKKFATFVVFLFSGKLNVNVLEDSSGVFIVDRWQGARGVFV